MKGRAREDILCSMEQTNRVFQPGVWAFCTYHVVLHSAERGGGYSLARARAREASQEPVCAWHRKRTASAFRGYPLLSAVSTILHPLLQHRTEPTKRNDPSIPALAPSNRLDTAERLSQRRQLHQSARNPRWRNRTRSLPRHPRFQDSRWRRVCQHSHGRNETMGLER